MVASCVPLVQVTLDTLKFDRSRAQTCGVWTPKAPGDTGYQGIISSLGDKTAAAPIWWVVVHKLSKGVTQAAVASIPCRPDLRQLRFEVQRTFIANRALADELQDFTNDCYSLAMYQWKQRDQGMTKDRKVLSDISWIGSSTFMQGITARCSPERQGRRFRGITPVTAVVRIRGAEVTQRAGSGGTTAVWG